MKNVTLNVFSMRSTHCQARVIDAIMTINGVEIQNIEAGRVSVIVENDIFEDDIVEVVENAGYAVESVSLQFLE